MAEKTISLPLSGLEIKTAIHDMIDQALNRDCFLNDSAAYDFMEGKITIDLKLNDMGREDEVKITVEAKGGDEPDNCEGTTVEIPVQKQPPNEVRIESGQDVPTESGQKIKYARGKKNG